MSHILSSRAQEVWEVFETGAWIHTQGNPAIRLLRLQILRDYYRAIHTELSKVYTLEGPTPKYQELAELELRLPRLRHLAHLNGTLEQLLLQIQENEATDTNITETELHIPSDIPGQYIECLGESRLMRPDRLWEFELVCEGERMGWKLAELQTSIPLQEVESWYENVPGMIWPSGVVLFAESIDPSSDIAKSTPPGNWPGQWYFLLRPSLKDPILELPDLTRSLVAQSEWRIIRDIKAKTSKVAGSAS